jgi:hypothetical protein
MSLPPFNQDGLLPPGDYEMTFDDLRASILVKPSLATAGSSWDEQWRLTLVNNAEALVKQLWQVGITQVFLDGSFVEDKDHPNDIDGYFECEVHRLASGSLQRELNALDPHKIWAWDPKSRRPDAKSAKKQLPMWHRYRVELYPHFGQSSKILDQFGNELQFPSAFRLSRREHKQKGIILVVPGS